MAEAMRKLRIMAIPLTRPLPHCKSRGILTYYQFQIMLPLLSNGKDKPNGVLTKWLPEGGVANWVTSKAAETWAGFGKQPKGWKRSIYQTGEKLMDRLDFEELALKSIDPSLGPTITRTPSPSIAESLKVPLLYPPSINTGPETLSDLRALVKYRTPKHKRGFYLWALVAPLTTPFMLIPLIPNIPFFFCVWRSWSHYRAYKASQYLNTLLEGNVIVPEKSRLLDSVYTQHSPRRPNPTPEAEKSEADVENSKSGRKQHAILLTRDAVPTIARKFALGTTAEADLYRAVEQARLRVESKRVEL
ncbi:hypothetical protein M378DRAFT_169819 [Amanita muscaria Koide BX008]|uniref:Mitochondrial K+-H+ exchange-related-domain-containing protein n=1 Tax=Amanita muscaria (strain Koide BX008) TaxID=946122 RepID=A0A0C2SY63_AMAMK|nr:hypothetical protein M378DRAFT_169819 [Amanita muscaria Koide BX008]